MGKNEEIETLNLFGESEEDKKINESIEETSEENTKETIFDEDLNQDIKNENDYKSKKSKRFLPLIIILVLVGLLCLGIYMWNSSNNKSLEKAMKEPAVDYFYKYKSVGTGASAYTVTLKELKKANNIGESYDLKAFDKCDDEETKAIINIDYVTGKVSNVEIKLSCKIF